MGKSRGIGTCFHINERGCTDVTKEDVIEDVLFRSRNAHQLQAILLAVGDLFVHSRECLHSSTNAPELSFTETR